MRTVRVRVVCVSIFLAYLLHPKQTCERCLILIGNRAVRVTTFWRLDVSELTFFEKLFDGGGVLGVLVNNKDSIMVADKLLFGRSTGTFTSVLLAVGSLVHHIRSRGALVRWAPVLPQI